MTSPHPRRSAIILAIVIPLALSLLGAQVPIGSARSASATPGGASGRGLPDAMRAYGRLPLSFEANVGQADSRARFLARGDGYTVFLTATGAVLALRGRGRSGAVVRLQLVGAGRRPHIVALRKLPGKINYYLGNDPRHWHVGVPTYARVEYRDVAPGVSVAFYGNRTQLEYDWILRPGADPASLRLRVGGGAALHLDGHGNLLIGARGVVIRQSRPLVYQMAGKGRRIIPSAYLLRAGNQVALRLGAYDTRKPLIVDPTVQYFTFLGGSGADQGYGVAADLSGNTYITGSTTSANFPVVNAQQPSYQQGLSDAFVTEIDPTGMTLIYSTYLGGSRADQGNDIVVDTKGVAYITGSTTSTDFPTTLGAAQPSIAGGQYAFAVGLFQGRPAFSTYVGGNGCAGNGIATDNSGNSFIVGTCTPSAAPISSTNPGSLYVWRVNANGTIILQVYQFTSNPPTPTPTPNPTPSTLPTPSPACQPPSPASAPNDVEGKAIALDAQSNLNITGCTNALNLPLANPFRGHTGGYDAFVMKMTVTGHLIYSTYLGGGTGNAYGEDIAIDPAGNAYVTGYTDSSDFPVQNALRPSSSGLPDAFITEFNTVGGLVYSTYLGGTGADYGTGIAVDSAGDAYVTGFTNSTAQFPVTGDAAQRTLTPGSPPGSYDAFLVELATNGISYLYGTYIGGTANDFGQDIALDSQGNALITGYTYSTFLGTGAQPNNAGPPDAFVVKFTGFVMGTGTPGVVTTATPAGGGGGATNTPASGGSTPGTATTGTAGTTGTGTATSGGTPGTATTGTAGTAGTATTGTPATIAAGTATTGTPGTAAPGGRATNTPLPTPTNPAIAATDLITNGGFESGTAPWVEFSAGNYELIGTTKFHGGAKGVWLCGGNNCTDQIWQTVTLPANFSNLTLSFWLWIDTQETSSQCNDSFTAQFRTKDGNPITTVVSKCNTDATNSWVQQTADVTADLRQFAGQQVQVFFQGKTNASLPTDFFLDDVSLLAQVPIPTATPTPTNTPPPTATSTPSPTATSTPTPVPSVQITALDLLKSLRGEITDTCDVVLAASAPLSPTSLLYPNQTGILRVLYRTTNDGGLKPTGVVVYQENGHPVDGDTLLPGTGKQGPFLCATISFSGKGVHHYSAQFTVNLGPSASDVKTLFFTVGKCANGTTGTKGQCIKCNKGYKLTSGKCVKIPVKKAAKKAAKKPVKKKPPKKKGVEAPSARRTRANGRSLLPQTVAVQAAGGTHPAATLPPAAR